MTLTKVQTKRLDEITVLRSGKGETKSPHDVCVMQAVDYVFRNADHFTDRPPCSSPVLTSFAVRLNDARWPDAATRTKYLRPLIPLLIGTKTESKTVERKRRYLFVDFAVREAAPFAFDAAFKRTKKEMYREWAAKLRAVAPVVDAKTQEAARAVARAYADAAYAAYAADAAYAAADAAYAAAYAAADAAYAAADAAYAAYADAAYADAAYALPILIRGSEVLAAACRVRR